MMPCEADRDSRRIGDEHIHLEKPCTRDRARRHYGGRRCMLRFGGARADELRGGQAGAAKRRAGRPLGLGGLGLGRWRCLRRRPRRWRPDRRRDRAAVLLWLRVSGLWIRLRLRVLWLLSVLLLRVRLSLRRRLRRLLRRRLLRRRLL